MTREEHLVSCKKCTQRKMDFKQGLVCELTNEKASFEGECIHFELDPKVKIIEEHKTSVIRPNKARASLAIKLIWVVMIMDIVAIGSSLMQHDLLTSFQNGEFITDDMADANDNRESAVGIVYFIIFLISGFTFIQWFRRAYYNLNKRTNVDYEDNWALICWMIPVISWFRPYQIMKEMWEKITILIQEKDSRYFGTLGTGVLGLWWALWIISNVIGNIVIRTSFKSDTVESLLNLTILDIGMSILGIPLALVTVQIISAYSVKEELLVDLEKSDVLEM